MDPVTLSIITSLAVNYFTAFTEADVRAFFEKAFDLEPSLEQQLDSAVSSEDLEQVLGKAAGVIEATAAHGMLEINGALLDAIRRIQFDHQHGTVTINNAIISSAIVVTGGGASATGTTTIGGNTELRSQGTHVVVENGASIKLTGNAKIRQT